MIFVGDKGADIAEERRVLRQIQFGAAAGRDIEPGGVLSAVDDGQFCLEHAEFAQNFGNAVRHAGDAIRQRVFFPVKETGPGHEIHAPGYDDPGASGHRAREACEGMGMARVGVQDIDVEALDRLRETPDRDRVKFPAKRAGNAREVLETVISAQEFAVRTARDRDEVPAQGQPANEITGLLFSPAPAVLLVKMQNAHRESPKRGSRRRQCAAQIPAG